MDTGESFYKKAYWKKRFIWKKPRRCELTNKWLWFTFAFEGVAMWMGPGGPIFEFRYHNVEEHFLWLLEQ